VPATLFGGVKLELVAPPMDVPPAFEALALLYHWYVIPLPLGLVAETLNALIAAFKQTD
jgi:hypothetical protein